MELTNRQLLPPLTIKKYHPAIILTLLFFLQVYWLSGQISSTNAPSIPGPAGSIIQAVLSVLLFKAITWWLIENIWPVLAHYSRQQFGQDFNSLSALQKVCIYLSFYLLLLYCFIAALTTLQ